MIRAIAGIYREFVINEPNKYDLKLRLLKNGKLPLESKEDLMFFSQVTKNDAVIMGRKTWETLPKSKRPLPDRQNYILSNQLSKAFLTEDEVLNPSIRHVYGLNDEEGALKDFLNKLEKEHDNIWIIGGVEIYKLFAPYIDEVILTANKTMPTVLMEEISDNSYIDFPIESFGELILINNGELTKLSNESTDVVFEQYVPLSVIKKNINVFDLKSKCDLLK